MTLRPGIVTPLAPVIEVRTQWPNAWQMTVASTTAEDFLKCIMNVKSRIRMCIVVSVMKSEI